VGLNLARLVYAVTMAVVVIAYYAVPSVRSAAAAAACAVSAAAIVLGVARLRPQRWGAWLLIAFAEVLLAVGGVIVFTGLAATTPVLGAYPGAPDVVLLTAALPLTAGLLSLGRPQLPSRDWPMILDTFALSLAGSLVVWLIVVGPAVTSNNLTGAGTVTAIAGLVAFVAVLAASVRMVLTWPTNLALALVGTGVVALLVARSLHGRALVNPTLSPGGPIDLGVLALAVLCGAAALTPSMARVASARHARHQLGPGRLAMLAVAMLVAPTALLVEATSGSLRTGVAIAVVSAAVGALMLVRLSLAAQAYRRRAAREHAVRVASRTLGVAIMDGEVVAAVDTALAAMLPAEAPHEVRLVDQGQEHNGGPTRSPLNEQAGIAAGEAGRGELSVPVDSETTSPARSTVQQPVDGLPGRAVVFIAPVTELVELSTILQTLADQAGSALVRIRLMAQLRAEERERYFRILVTTNTDVILISRGGRIDYATPSAQSMFGRDITGARLDDLGAPPPTSRPRRRPTPTDVVGHKGRCRGLRLPPGR
jgi:PAS domain-containing protein